MSFQVSGQLLWSAAIFQFFIMYATRKAMANRIQQNHALGGISNVGPSEIFLVSAVYILLIYTPLPLISGNVLFTGIVLGVICVALQTPLRAIKIETAEVLIGIMGVWLWIALGTSIPIVGTMIKNFMGTMGGA